MTKTKVEDFYGMQLNDLYGVLQKLLEEIEYARSVALEFELKNQWTSYDAWNLHVLRMERLLEND